MFHRVAARRLDRWSLRAQTRIVFAIPLVALLLLQIGVRHYSDQGAAFASEIDDLEEWRFDTLALYEQLVEAESAVRGYRLAGGADQAFLAPYFEILRTAPALVRKLAARAADYPQLAEHAQRLDRLVDQRLLALTQMRQLPPGMPAGAARVRAQAEEGRRLSESISEELDAFSREEAHLKSLREQRLHAVRRMEDALSIGVPVLLLVLFLLVQWLNGRVLRRLGRVGRNVVSLVEGRELEPLPPDSREARDLNAALDRAANLLSRRETQRLAAKHEAERANAAKTAFLSRMSHELRTPLTAVLGFAELLEMDELSDDQRDSVRHISGAGRHLLTLINEVLDISRIESGNLAVSIEPVEVGEIMAGALALMRPLAEETGIRLPRACGEGVFVRADRQRVTQVLLNLLSNAVKYNRPFGDIAVTCDTGDGVVRIAVADTGMGIAPELLPRVFAPFDRLGAEQTGVEGTGVGLVLSKGLAEAMDGTLTLESTAGVGSTFTLELPLADQTAARQPALAPPPAAAPGDVQAVTVLYVEDNAANLDLVARFIGQLPGVELITTMQGRLAVDMARAHRPDLVLLDLHLPDLDGEAVLRRLRADPETAAIRVVMLTADATPGQERRLRALGADDYLTKPLNFARLSAVLRPEEPVVPA